MDLIVITLDDLPPDDEPLLAHALWLDEPLLVSGDFGLLTGNTPQDVPVPLVRAA